MLSVLLLEFSFEIDWDFSHLMYSYNKKTNICIYFQTKYGHECHYFMDFNNFKTS